MHFGNNAAIQNMLIVLFSRIIVKVLKRQIAELTTQNDFLQGLEKYKFLCNIIGNAE